MISQMHITWQMFKSTSESISRTIMLSVILKTTTLKQIFVPFLLCGPQNTNTSIINLLKKYSLCFFLTIKRKFLSFNIIRGKKIKTIRIIPYIRYISKTCVTELSNFFHQNEIIIVNQLVIHG